MTTADLQHEYETFYVTKPELPDDEVNRISEKLLGAIERSRARSSCPRTGAGAS
jgi:ribosomal protein S6